jgi:hypothetical protein
VGPRARRECGAARWGARRHEPRWHREDTVHPGPARRRVHPARRGDPGGRRRGNLPAAAAPEPPRRDPAGRGPPRHHLLDGQPAAPVRPGHLRRPGRLLPGRRRRRRGRRPLRQPRRTGAAAARRRPWPGRRGTPRRPAPVPHRRPAGRRPVCRGRSLTGHHLSRAAHAAATAQRGGGRSGSDHRTGQLALRPSRPAPTSCAPRSPASAAPSTCSPGSATPSPPTTRRSARVPSPTSPPRPTGWPVWSASSSSSPAPTPAPPSNPGPSASATCLTLPAGKPNGWQAA